MSNESHSDSKQHALFAMLLGIMGLLILLVFITIRSQADNASTTSDVTNSLPTVDSIVVNGASDVTLTENTTTSVTVSGTFTDLNTCNNVATGGQIKIALGRSGNFTADDCGAYDNNNCVTESVTTLTGSADGTYWDCSVGDCSSATDTTGSYTCTANLQYYMQPTDSGTYAANTLEAAVSLHDGTGFGSIATNVAQELNTTTAIVLDDSSINYGTLALAATSAQQTVVITNSGNSISGIKVQISGTDMGGVGCTNSIDKGQQHWDDADQAETAWSDAAFTALTASAADMVTSIAKATSATPVTASTYWKLKLPDSGVGGTCAGTVTYGPVAL